MRLIVATPELGPNLFADFYSAAAGAGRRPLLVYFSGALSERRYEQRRMTEPAIVVETFRESGPGAAAWNLLVFQPPPTLVERGHDLRRIVGGLLSAFVQASLNPEPPAIAAVGMSYGALLGCAYALEVQRCNRLATLAGVGMAEVTESAPWEAVVGKAFKCFVNDGDPLSEHSHRFAEQMRGYGHRVEVVTQHGEHSFMDFVANGSATEAFKFAVLGR
jgi:pimeloyl-ACP methyl ester carboxylesterase